MSDNREAYLDTSALAKWYLAETNSEQVSDFIISLGSAVLVL
ncbi:MAG: hypothetical protein ABL925_06755 [Methylococcales bacterium]